MLSIGEFSKICMVSTKTLRYYAEIGLIIPDEINQENGYRYYSIEQLEKMLLIDRLKAYNFSLEEIKTILHSNKMVDEQLCLALINKKREIEKQAEAFKKTLDQLNNDIENLKQGKSIMTYLEEIDIQLVEVSTINLLSIRKMVLKDDFPKEYETCFNKLFRYMIDNQLTMSAPPMVLFHSDEFTPFGMDTEFAIPIKEVVTRTRDFNPGLCLKTTLQGTYSDLPSIYTKQCEWAEKNGYENNKPLFEVYVSDPTHVTNENELITEIYYPVKKKRR